MSAPFGEPTTTVISIGRRIGTSATMSDPAWDRFRRETVEVARAHCGEVFFSGTGRGQYEGVVEESFTVIAQHPTDRAALRERLANLARMYGQESIAVTFGVTYFEEAKRV